MEKEEKKNVKAKSTSKKKTPVKKESEKKEPVKKTAPKKTTEVKKSEVKKSEVKEEVKKEEVVKIENKSSAKLDKICFGILMILLVALAGFMVTVFLVMYNHVLEIKAEDVRTTTYVYNEKAVEILEHSVFDDACCDTAIKFRTFVEYDNIKKELTDMLDSYEKIVCGKNTYYYNAEGDYTVTEVFINERFLVNNYTIVYSSGKYSCQ